LSESTDVELRALKEYLTHTSLDLAIGGKWGGGHPTLRKLG